MISNILDWFLRNWVEILGTVLGISYVFLSIKQNILTWLMGLLTSALYIYVFFTAKFYADMALQVYYVWISIYGWILWSQKQQNSPNQEVVHIVHINIKQSKVLLVISILLWFIIYFILKYFTDSPIPLGDSFTTALSIVGTWMLAKKILEHWIIWIVVDMISLILYIMKGLYPTSIMFVIYTIAALWGYFEWKKELKTNE